MKKNEKGLGAVGLLAVIAIVGLVGAAGWLVYDGQSSKKSDNTKTTSGAQQEEASNNKEESTTQLYENKTLGFSFTYPKDWSKEIDVINETFKDNIILKSSDYKPVPDGPFGEVEVGGIFRIQVSTTEYKDTATYKANDSYMSNPQDVIIGGISAVRQDKCGHPTQQSTCIGFVKEGLYYSLSYEHTTQESTADAKYKKEFEDLLSSFKFN